MKLNQGKLITVKHFIAFFKMFPWVSGYLVNGVRKSKIGCNRTKTMKNKTRNTNVSDVWLTSIDGRLKTIQVTMFCKLLDEISFDFQILIESERKLDTLPEEKFVPTTPNPCTKTSNPILTNCVTNSSNNSQNRDGYKRVYQDWKPSKTLETDVVGTIEAIASTLFF